MFKVMQIAFGDFFESYDYDFLLIPIPYKRATPLLNAERVDGICAVTEVRHSNLTNQKYLLADHHHGYLQVVVASTQNQQLPRSMNELVQLQNQGAIIGYIGGSSDASYLDLDADTAQNVVSMERGVRVLAAGRIDYLLATRLLLEKARESIQSEKTFYYSPALGQLKLYNALHEKLQHLRAPLNQHLHHLTTCLKGDEAIVASRQWLPMVTNPDHPCRMNARNHLKTTKAIK